MIRIGTHALDHRAATKACIDQIISGDDEWADAFKNDLPLVLEFLRLKEPAVGSNGYKDKMEEFWANYASNSFSQAYLAYEGAEGTGVSCSKGIWERLFAGLSVVDLNISKMLQEIGGRMALPELLNATKNLEGFRKQRENKDPFPTMEEAYTAWVDFVYQSAHNSGLHLDRPYAINTTYSELNSYLSLREEIKERFSASDYKDAFQSYCETYKLVHPLISE